MVDFYDLSSRVILYKSTLHSDHLSNACPYFVIRMNSKYKQETGLRMAFCIAPEQSLKWSMFSTFFFAAPCLVDFTIFGALQLAKIFSNFFYLQRANNNHNLRFWEKSLKYHLLVLQSSVVFLSAYYALNHWCQRHNIAELNTGRWWQMLKGGMTA